MIKCIIDDNSIENGDVKIWEKDVVLTIRHIREENDIIKAYVYIQMPIFHLIAYEYEIKSDDSDRSIKEKITSAIVSDLCNKALADPITEELIMGQFRYAEAKKKYFDQKKQKK